MLAAPGRASVVTEPALAEQAAARPDSLRLVWVFLDKGMPAPAALDALRSAGFRPRHVSRWFNAVSGFIDNQTLSGIENLPHVRHIRRVAAFRRAPSPVFTLPKRNALPAGYFGNLQAEMDLIRVSHALESGRIQPGNAGRGIRIALFDSGFRTDLPVFGHFNDSTIIAKRDYVAGMVDTSLLFDTTVRDDFRDYPGQESHGTSVLSIIASLLPGTMTGVAPYARFVLLKTERVADLDGHPVETSQEEDAWVAACEWVVDSVGVDIISTSLGYHYDFTDGRSVYNQAMLNGDSLLITRAADMAAQKGVAVFVSAGNEGIPYGAGSLSAPADGDSVMAVGGCDARGDFWPYTAYGPTGDGRAKPDISAPGQDVFVAMPGGGYATSDGTSFAAPFAAGACALLLQAVPSLKDSGYKAVTRLKNYAYFPEDVSTQSRSDPRYGAGILNLVAALAETVSVEPYRPVLATSFHVVTLPEKRTGITFVLKIPNDAGTVLYNPELTIRIFTLSGKLVNRMVLNGRDRIRKGLNAIEWNARNNSGREIGKGIYLVQAEFKDGGSSPEEWTQKLAYIP